MSGVRRGGFTGAHFRCCVSTFVSQILSKIGHALSLRVRREGEMRGRGKLIIGVMDSLKFFTIVFFVENKILLLRFNS